MKEEIDAQKCAKFGNRGNNGTSDPNGTNGADTTKDGFCTTELADLPGETLLDEPALAHLLDTSSRTIRRMVYRGQLPAGIKLGGRRVWMVKKLLEYLTDEADRMAGVSKKTAARFRIVE